MRHYSEEVQSQLRSRWELKEKLLEEILTILNARTDDPGILRERLIHANQVLIDNGFGLDKHRSKMINVYLVGEIPVLDLRYIKFPKNYFGMKIILCGACLDGADLTGANLGEGRFECASLESAIIKDAQLPEAHFEKASLKGVKIINSNLNAAHLEGADLCYASMENVSLSFAFLNGANLRDVTLKAVDFSNAQLNGAWFIDTKIYCSTYKWSEVGVLKEFNGDCLLSTGQQKELIQKRSITIFHLCDFLPRWSEHFWDFSEFRFSYFLYQLKRVRFKQAISICKSIKMYQRINWKNFRKHLFNRWFYNDFESVRIENADTIMAPDLYRYIKDQQYLVRFKKTHPGIYWFWKIFSDCGGKLSVVAFWALLAIGIFAVLFGTLPWPAPGWLQQSPLSFLIINEPPINPKSLSEFGENLTAFWKWFFASFDIFTNLGIRNTHPQNWVGVLLVFFETVTGYTSLGMLISVLQTRFAQRS